MWWVVRLPIFYYPRLGYICTVSHGLIVMRDKLLELVGHTNIWIFLVSQGWIANVEILDVTRKTVTLGYYFESDQETRYWEKTTRIRDVIDIDVRFAVCPREGEKLEQVRKKMTDLL